MGEGFRFPRRGPSRFSRFKPGRSVRLPRLLRVVSRLDVCGRRLKRSRQILGSSPGGLLRGCPIPAPHAHEFGFQILDARVKAGAVGRGGDSEKFSVDVVHEFVDECIEKRLACDDLFADRREIRNFDHRVSAVVDAVELVGEFSTAQFMGLPLFEHAQARAGDFEASADVVEQFLAQRFALMGALGFDELSGEFALLGFGSVFESREFIGAREIRCIAAPAHERWFPGRVRAEQIADMRWANESRLYANRTPVARGPIRA